MSGLGHVTRYRVLDARREKAGNTLAGGYDPRAGKYVAGSRTRLLGAVIGCDRALLEVPPSWRAPLRINYLC